MEAHQAVVTNLQQKNKGPSATALAALGRSWHMTNEAGKAKSSIQVSASMHPTSITVAHCSVLPSTASEINAYWKDQFSCWEDFTLFTLTTGHRSQSQDELECNQVPKASLVSSPPLLQLTHCCHTKPVLAWSQDPPPQASSHAISIQPALNECQSKYMKSHPYGYATDPKHL